ncbi:putative protein kinase domain, leucine-rich repeat domain superfamily [Plasmopara halstedii]
MLALRGLQSVSAVNANFVPITSQTSPNMTTYLNTTVVSKQMGPSSRGQVTTGVTNRTEDSSTVSDNNTTMSTNHATKIMGTATDNAGNTTTKIATMKGSDEVPPVPINTTEGRGNFNNVLMVEEVDTNITTAPTATETLGSNTDGSTSRSTSGFISPISSESISKEDDAAESIAPTPSAEDQNSFQMLTVSNSKVDFNTTANKEANTAISAVTQSVYDAAVMDTSSSFTVALDDDESDTSRAPSMLTKTSEKSTISGSEAVAASFVLPNSSSSSSFLTSWFHSNFRNNETQLFVSNRDATTLTNASPHLCAGLPALVTRSDSETPNGGCPDELTVLNASCTCITGYDYTASVWTFHITKELWNSTTSAPVRSLIQSSFDKLAIDTIRPIWVPSSVQTLTIKGADRIPSKILFVNDIRYVSGSSLALVKSVKSSINVSTLSIHNVDLNLIAMKRSDFIPASVINLTLHNCNISNLGASFTRNWSRLQFLDLSLNNIDTEFIGGPYLRELNLSYNALSMLPIGSLNTSKLEALHIQGNDIKDFNVSLEVFEQILRLKAFTADKPSLSSSCGQGVWKIAHGATFCVLSASTAALPDLSPSSGSNSDDNDGFGALSYWLIVGAIAVLVLLFLIVRQHRRRNREHDSLLVSPEAIEVVTPKAGGTTAFNALNRKNSFAAVPVGRAATHSGYSHPKGSSPDSEDFTALNTGLLSSAILASCRLDYDEVALGRCISRGGFGLVFVGCYRGRQVAVKKIRNEREVTRDQVEQFVCEITLIAGLSHPRIVEFIGACWTTPTELSAVTELMERGDLRDVTQRFKRSGYRLTWESHKMVIAYHIAEALTYLHGLNPTVIHRDLKAKNVLLNADMEAKLSDFGIARERSSYDGSEHMTVGIGTSFWIAPEVLLGRDYDERADIYSFGVVLSEIDTDDYPYWNAQNPPQGKAQENEILRLVARGVKRPSFSENCPREIHELATRCLRADPAERPSALDIVIYLQQLVQESRSTASYSSTIQPLQSNESSSNHSSFVSENNSNLRVLLDQSTKGNQARSKPPSIASNQVCGQKTTASISHEFATTLEMVATSPQVTHQIIRTTRFSKVEHKATKSAVTSWRASQCSTNGNASGHFATSIAVTGETRIQNGGSTLPAPSSRTHTAIGPTSPSSIHTRNVDQQLLSSSSGKEATRRLSQVTGVGHFKQEWIVYEDVKEL